MSVIIIAAIVFSVTMIICTAGICLTAIKLDKSNESRRAVLNCLVQFVDEINRRFPGSTLKVVDNEVETKVSGELKYKEYKYND